MVYKFITMRNFFIICLLQIFLSGLYASNLVFADDKPEQEQALTIFEKGEVIALQEILKDAQRRYGGELLEVDLEYEKSNWIYEITILVDDTQLLKLIYNAASGALNKVVGHDQSMFGEIENDHNEEKE